MTRIPLNVNLLGESITTDGLLVDEGSTFDGLPLDEGPRFTYWWVNDEMVLVDAMRANWYSRHPGCFLDRRMANTWTRTDSMYWHPDWQDTALDALDDERAVKAARKRVLATRAQNRDAQAVLV